MMAVDAPHKLLRFVATKRHDGEALLAHAPPP